MRHVSRMVCVVVLSVVGVVSCKTVSSPSAEANLVEVPQTACLENQIAVGQHCCWPGQHLETDGQCSGTPWCPSGHIPSQNEEDGEVCVAVSDDVQQSVDTCMEVAGTVVRASQGGPSECTLKGEAKLSDFLSLLDQKCIQGQLRACSTLGQIYVKGSITYYYRSIMYARLGGLGKQPQPDIEGSSIAWFFKSNVFIKDQNINYFKGLKLLEQACVQGEASACFGFLHSVEKDRVKFVPYKNLCLMHREPQMCSMLIFDYRDRLNEEELLAVKYVMDYACLMGDVIACNNKAMLTYRGKIPYVYGEPSSIEILEDTCLGDPAPDSLTGMSMKLYTLGRRAACGNFIVLSMEDAGFRSETTPTPSTDRHRAALDVLRNGLDDSLPFYGGPALAVAHGIGYGVPQDIEIYQSIMKTYCSEFSDQSDSQCDAFNE